jgi:5,10-methylene-tetrahydrofolate dehydrogenase/methenyl tetrahydrofolate cyclohydrolase
LAEQSAAGRLWSSEVQDARPSATRPSLITPVPGGVGLMTIAKLLTQTVTAAAHQLGFEPNQP